MEEGVEEGEVEGEKVGEVEGVKAGVGVSFCKMRIVKGELEGELKVN